MAFDGSNKAWCPSLSQTRSKEWRLRIAKFGDGYEQRTLDGINPLDVVWKVAFEAKPYNVIQDMEAYLTTRLARAFPYQDPATGEIFNVFCDKWDVDWIRVVIDTNGNRKSLNGTLTAEFRKANGATVLL